MRQPHGDESRCEHGVILTPLDRSVASQGGQVKSTFCHECWASVRADEREDVVSDIAEALDPMGIEMVEKQLRAFFERRQPKHDPDAAD